MCYVFHLITSILKLEKREVVREASCAKIQCFQCPWVHHQPATCLAFLPFGTRRLKAFHPNWPHNIFQFFNRYYFHNRINSCTTTKFALFESVELGIAWPRISLRVILMLWLSILSSWNNLCFYWGLSKREEVFLPFFHCHLSHDFSMRAGEFEPSISPFGIDVRGHVKPTAGNRAPALAITFSHGRHPRLRSNR